MNREKPPNHLGRAQRNNGGWGEGKFGGPMLPSFVIGNELLIKFLSGLSTKQTHENLALWPFISA